MKKKLSFLKNQIFWKSDFFSILIFSDVPKIDKLAYQRPCTALPTRDISKNGKINNRRIPGASSGRKTNDFGEVSCFLINKSFLSIILSLYQFFGFRIRKTVLTGWVPIILAFFLGLLIFETGLLTARKNGFRWTSENNQLLIYWFFRSKLTVTISTTGKDDRILTKTSIGYWKNEKIFFFQKFHQNSLQITENE